MSFCTFLSPPLRLMSAVALAFLTGCKTKQENSIASEQTIAGKSHLHILIDGAEASESVAANALRWEFITLKDTFRVKLANNQLTFPKLPDSILSVKVYYNERFFELTGNELKSEYPAMYFPGLDARILIDNYPFENPIAKHWLRERKERTFYEIHLPEARFFFTSMGKPTIRHKEKL